MKLSFFKFKILNNTGQKLAIGCTHPVSCLKRISHISTNLQIPEHKILAQTYSINKVILPNWDDRRNCNKQHITIL